MGGRASDVMGYSGASGGPLHHPLSAFSYKLVVLVTVNRLAGNHLSYFLRDQWSAAGPPPPKTTPSILWGDTGGVGPGMAHLP